MLRPIAGKIDEESHAQFGFDHFRIWHIADSLRRLPARPLLRGKADPPPGGGMPNQRLANSSARILTPWIAVTRSTGTTQCTSRRRRSWSVSAGITTTRTLLKHRGVAAMRTRIPKLIAEINTIIADHSRSDSKEEQEAIDLLKRARDALSVARAKLQEADVKKNRVA